MGDEGFLGAQMVEPDQNPNQDEGMSSEGGTGVSRGLDLGGLLSGLLGDAGGVGSAGGEGHTGGPDLAGLLGGLLGGEGAGAGSGGLDLSGLLGGLLGGGASGLDVNAVAEESGVSGAAVQAAIPLVLGALVQGRQQHASGAGADQPAPLAELAERARSGKPISSNFLNATGLPQELARRTGLNQSGALATILAILRALGIVPRTTGSGAAARPRPKPRPVSQAKPKAKPKPKPAPGAKPKAEPKAKPKAKPKPASGAAKPKPKPRRGSR